jgi:hypothetical protein
MMKNKQREETDREKQREDLLKDFDFDYIDNCSYIQTFKVFSNTKFVDLKMAACNFWQFMSHEKFILTDEYFNNLAAYDQSVQSFFADPNFQPLNSDRFACVFLIRKNDRREKLHFLQLESVELKDDDNPNKIQKNEVNLSDEDEEMGIGQS